MNKRHILQAICNAQKFLSEWEELFAKVKANPNSPPALLREIYVNWSYQGNLLKELTKIYISKYNYAPL